MSSESQIKEHDLREFVDDYKAALIGSGLAVSTFVA